MKKRLLYSPILFLVLFIFSCKNENKPTGKAIVLGDSSLIVTEKDSQYLKNQVQDITPTNKKTIEGNITKMMVQVDSLSAAKKIDEENLAGKTLAGFTINFNECTVIFEKLLAHSLKLDQNERTLNRVSYVKDGGDFLEMKLETKGIENTTIEERLFTKMGIVHNGKTYILDDLGKFTSPWYNLAGKNNIFVSVGTNSMQFSTIDNTKIKNGLDRELRKDKKTRTEIVEWMDLVKNTNTYTDAPCTLIISSAQWRIKGTQNGKHIQKLIQFDEVK